MRSFDPRLVGALECRAWETYYRREWRAFLRVHRAHQGGAEGLEALVAALTDLYTHTYGVDRAAVCAAARLRAEAMDVSDAWVERGCSPDDSELARERALLVRSYAALLSAMHR